MLDVYGTLEITDSSNNHSGKITSTEITNNTNPNSNAVWVNPGANVTITGGTFTAKTWSVVVAGSGDAASLIVNGENVVIEMVSVVMALLVAARLLSTLRLARFRAMMLLFITPR